MGRDEVGWGGTGLGRARRCGTSYGEAGDSFICHPASCILPAYFRVTYCPAILFSRHVSDAFMDMKNGKETRVR